MLIIAQATAEAFETRGLSDFEGRLLGHLRRVYPRHAAGLGEARLREVIEGGIRAAEASGLASELDIARYVGICVAAGGELLASPHAAWAAPVLRDEGRTPDGKIARLRVLARRRGIRFSDETRP